MPCPWGINLYKSQQYKMKKNKGNEGINEHEGITR